MLKHKLILEKEWNDLKAAANEIDINIKQQSDTLMTVRISFPLFLISLYLINKKYMLIEFYYYYLIPSFEKLLKRSR